MLNVLRNFLVVGRHPVDNDFRLDVRWWHNFLPTYSGKSIMWHLEIPGIDTMLATDASLHGGGAVCDREFFKIRFPHSLLSLVRWGISHLEMHTLILALKVWPHKVGGKKFIVACDNEACVHLINRGRAKDKLMQSALRELASVAAQHDFWIRAEYINTKSNVLPDLLSRWPFNRRARHEFRALNSKIKT